MSYTLLDLKRAEDAGEICAMEDATQSVMCLHEPLHAGPHSWQPYLEDEDEATPYTEQETTNG
jgi:hypothetical protein